VGDYLVPGVQGSHQEAQKFTMTGRPCHPARRPARPGDAPEAPKANSLVPSVNVIVINDASEVLMIRRTDISIPAHRLTSAVSR
jgi:hypothetical protein